MRQPDRGPVSRSSSAWAAPRANIRNVALNLLVSFGHDREKHGGVCPEFRNRRANFEAERRRPQPPGQRARRSAWRVDPFERANRAANRAPAEPSACLSNRATSSAAETRRTRSDRARGARRCRARLGSPPPRLQRRRSPRCSACVPPLRVLKLAAERRHSPVRSSVRKQVTQGSAVRWLFYLRRKRTPKPQGGARDRCAGCPRAV